MKRVYERPLMTAEQFAANEYVAACITGTIQCMYPGDGYTNGREIYDDYNGRQSGWYKDSSGMLHGICGNDATISFNGDTASGYEAIDGVIQTNRVIYGITGYEQKEGTYTVTWHSKVDNSDEYTHKGRLIVTNVDNSRPNHS